MNAFLEVTPYALVAALSPVGFAATLTVMKGGRLKALGFAVGVVLGQLLACVVLVLIGTAAVPDRKSDHPTFDALLELVLGLALLGLAVRVRRRPLTKHPGSNGRSQAVLDRLEHVHVVTALAAGLLLGIGGPKRLVLTALASASIAAAGIGGTKEGAVIGWYVILATVLVWVPALAFLLLGDWAVTRLDTAFSWLARHQRQATFYALSTLGLLLVADAVVRFYTS